MSLAQAALSIASPSSECCSSKCARPQDFGPLAKGMTLLSRSPEVGDDSVQTKAE